MNASVSVQILRCDQEALVLSCSGQTWSDGTVDLCGLPW